MNNVTAPSALFPGLQVQANGGGAKRKKISCDVERENVKQERLVRLILMAEKQMRNTRARPCVIRFSS